MNAGWGLDFAELRAAFTDKTRILLLNTPQNPTGKMLTREDLQHVADILRDYPRVIVVSDEVYENMTYDGHVHHRFATLPGMWEKTITVSSAGKTFSITGWKIGYVHIHCTCCILCYSQAWGVCRWTIGPAELIRGIVTTNQWVQFSVSTPGQQAVASCLELADKPYKGFATYYEWLRAEYTRKRDVLMTALASSGTYMQAPRHPHWS
jgi:aspartate/methionine/tyrosine aminotransferase